MEQRQWLLKAMNRIVRCFLGREKSSVTSTVSYAYWSSERMKPRAILIIAIAI